MYNEKSCIVRVYTCINVIGVRDESFISNKSVMSAEGLKLPVPKGSILHALHC